MSIERENISRMNFLCRSGPVTFGDVCYRPGGVCGPRIQPDYQLVVMHHGEVEIRIERRMIQLSAGEGILLRPRRREFFTFSRGEEARHSWCSIEADAVPRKLRRRFAQLDRPAAFGARMTTVLDWCRGLREPGDIALQERICLDLGLALLCDFALAADHALPQEPGRLALGRLADFVRMAYAEPATLTTMARAVGVSPQHLLRLCREAQVPTPREQLYRRRLEVAAELLLGTGISVAEIAERCGFVSPFHFSRKFREAHGKSPFAWRQQRWSTHKARRAARK